jgi:hypothetical protein
MRTNNIHSCFEKQNCGFRLHLKFAHSVILVYSLKVSAVAILILRAVWARAKFYVCSYVIFLSLRYNFTHHLVMVEQQNLPMVST